MPEKNSDIQTVCLTDIPIDEIVGDIGWTPFFVQWGFQSAFPQVLHHPQTGEQARKLWEDVQSMLEKWKNGINAPELRAVAALFPALSEYENVLLYASDEDRSPFARLHFLRNQERAGSHACLSDFIRSEPDKEGKKDRIGCFVLTSAAGLEAQLESSGKVDEYQRMLAHTLAFRLAEALSEYLHRRVSKIWWNSDQALGIRPAPGYPSCPDHSEKSEIFKCLQAEEKIGVHLTESYAMLPQASVAGYYFFSDQAHYFKVGRIGEDQKKVYAQYKGMTLEEIQKYIS